MCAAAVRQGHLRLLGWLDLRRFANGIRSPFRIAAIAAGLLLAASTAALVVGSEANTIERAGASAGLQLGLVVSGVISFVGYGLLFGSRDASFLRQIGVEASALYMERSLRVSVAAAATAVAAAVGLAAAGAGFVGVLIVAIACASAAVAALVMVYAWAARAAAMGGASYLGLGMRKFDPELARVAPLVYAPLVPFLAGALIAAAASAAGRPALAALPALGLATMAIPLAAWTFAPVAPRFLAAVSEMSYLPAAASSVSPAGHPRGLVALLPRRAALAAGRDALAGRRRYPWMVRVNWIAGIASVVALARWGDDPTVRFWAVAVVGLTLIAHGSAAIGVGRAESQGRRWVDRTLGLALWERALGRFAWVWATSLWLLIPVALAWGWWSGSMGAWLFPVSGAASAAAATLVSMALAESR